MQVRTTFNASRFVARAALAALLGAMLAILLGTAAWAQPSSNYPDLVADPPESVQPPEVFPWLGAELLGVRFDGFVTNIGGGPLHIEGNPQPSAAGTAGAVAQHILNPDGATLQRFPLATTGTTPAIQFENSDGHQHWHLMEIMEYSLWNQAKTQQVTAGAKIGFCLFDIERVGSSGPVDPVYVGGGNWCASGDPSATDLQMGVSPGWRDVYGQYLALQWVDVSAVAPGNYYLAALADPNDIVVESNESNNSYSWTDTLTVVPGYVAGDVGQLAVTGPQSVALSSQSFGSGLGARAFVVVSGPSHGTLNVPTGTPFTASSVTYTPTGGYDGQDSFTYYAYDAASAYPTNRATLTATATLNVATPNQAPSLAAVANQFSVVGADVALQLNGTDADTGDTLTYSATGLPPGLALNPSTGLISGRPTSLINAAVNATVTDGAAVDSVTFAWTVTAAPVFGDVQTDHRFAEAIAWMAAQGISRGCEDGSKFCPDDPVSRGQVASFLARAFKLTAGAGDDLFADDDGSVHEANIDALATAQITFGCTATTFCPTRDVTRAQFASLLVRATGMTGGEGGDRFTDDDGSVHEQNIDILAFNGVTSGCTTTTFCPNQPLTRGQLAQLLFVAIG